MARRVTVGSVRSDAYLQPNSSSNALDYRALYREVRSNPSVSGLHSLADSMRVKAKRLVETADRLQRI